MTSLLPLFCDQLIPWVQDGLAQRLIVAQPVMQQNQMPSGVKLTRKKIPGKRIVVRNQRHYGNQRIVCAQWPGARLHELEIPKLVCITEGTADFRAGEYLITCPQGHFIFLPPRTPISAGGQPHLAGEALKNGACDVLQFPLYRDAIQCFRTASRGKEYLRDDNFNFLIRQPEAVEVFKLFCGEIQVKPARDSQLWQHLLSAMLFYIVSEVKAGKHISMIEHPSDFQEATSRRTHQKNSIPEIHRYMKSHLKQQLTIEKVARHTYMSPRQLTRYLRQEANQTFIEILNECRMEEAKRLLLNTHWSIATVATELGFESQAYFNVFFKRHENCTPGAFRKNMQKPKVGQITKNMAE